MPERFTDDELRAIVNGEMHSPGLPGILATEVLAHRARGTGRRGHALQEARTEALDAQARVAELTAELDGMREVAEQRLVTIREVVAERNEARARVAELEAQQQITDAAKADELPDGTVILVAGEVVAQRISGVGGVLGRWWQVLNGDEIDTSDELMRLSDAESVTVLHVPACPHDSRSGARGRWRCDQCGADCGPDAYLTPTEEADRG